MPVASFVPSRIHYDYPEWTAPGGGDTGKVWAWNGSGYVPVSLAFDPAGTAAAAVAAHVAAANPHSQYYLASGVSAYGATLIDDADAAAARGTLGLGTMAVATEASYLLTDGSRAGATSSRQAFTGGITTGSIRPPVDGATAFQVQNAAGTPVVTVDTTNKRLGINVAAISPLSIQVDGAGQGFNIIGTNGNFIFQAGGVNGAGLLSQANTSTKGFVIGTSAGSTVAGSFVRIQTSGADAMTINHLGHIGIPTDTQTALLDLAASTTSRASLRIRSGTAPTTPNVGDVYQDGTHVYMYLAGAWKQLDN